MRCPHCGGLNPDKNTYCTYCGRDLRAPLRPAAGQYPPVQQPRPMPPPAPQGHPASTPQAPARPGRTVPQSGTPAPTQARPQAQARPASEVAPAWPAVPPQPDPPGPFPPRTLAELQALEQGALAYTVLGSETGVGRKKIVRIVYPGGAAWQQVATLLKALKEQQDEQFECIIIQGVLDQDTSIYTFTNGQLRFDRDVRLGGSITNRYQIETGTGFESDAMRIVLNT